MSNFRPTNRLDVTGPVIQLDIQDTSYNGTPVVRGKIVVKTDLAEITIDFYQTATYKSGKENNTYRILRDLVVGNIYTFQCTLDENKFVPSGREEVARSYRANLTFINKPIDSSVHTSSFRFLGIVTRGLQERRNQEGEIYAYEIMVGQPQYKEEKGLNVFRFNVPVDSPNLEIIQSNYTRGRTVDIAGHIESVMTTVEKEQAVEFGEPVIQTYSNKFDYYFIDTGIQVPEAQVYSDEDIAKLVEATKKAEADLLKGNNTPKPVAAAKVAPTKAPARDPFEDF